MIVISEILKNMSTIVEEVITTASYVNKDSHTRKKITSESLVIIEELIGENNIIKSNFTEILEKLRSSLMNIDNNSKDLKSNFDNFSQIIINLNSIKNTLNTLEKEIDNLTSIVEEIKVDTDEIHLLAINASIESSKYSHNAKVFDVLANKLNEMSSFINQN